LLYWLHCLLQLISRSTPYTHSTMFLSRATRPASRLLQSVQLRCMSVDGVKGFNERESAMENLYFTKEDERLLRGLLTKVKKQSDVKDKPAAAGVLAAELAALKNITSKYNISDADVSALMDWKHKVF
jgi:hypothetical protein